MKIILLAIIFTVFSVYAFIGTTYDKAFEEKYKVRHIKSGNGKIFPARGKKVSVHYTGVFLDGKIFESSFDRNQPFKFAINRKTVIPCFDEVVSKMSVGEKISVPVRE